MNSDTKSTGYITLLGFISLIALAVGLVPMAIDLICCSIKENK